MQLRQREDHRRLKRLLAQKTRQVRTTFACAIDSLVRTLEVRDPYTCGHSLRVRRYVLRLAEAVGLNALYRRRLSLAATLHDIGKLGVPEVILHKPSPLYDEEIGIIRDHPIIGERILAPIIRNPGVLQAIRAHHERYDGGGYPDGLRGDQIPFLARLIAVADCFDAMTSSRAYREALPWDEAKEFLRRGAGTQFDPALVGPFLEVLEHQTAE